MSRPTPRSEAVARAYLDNLPPEMARTRVVGAAEAAAFCGFSVHHWRRLNRAGKVPKPVRLSGSKLGWQQGALVDFITQRAG